MRQWPMFLAYLVVAGVLKALRPLQGALEREPW